MGGGQGSPGDWELLDQGGDHGVQDGGRQGGISRGWGEGGYDVWVEARDPLGTGNYWIRAETMEYSFFLSFFFLSFFLSFILLTTLLKLQLDKLDLNRI